MANFEMKNTKIILRNDVAANWEQVNPVLLKGEIGIATDRNLFKIGDGVTAWKALEWAGALGDAKTIDTVAGQLSLHDFGVQYYKYVPATENAEATYTLTQGFKAGLVPKIVSSGDGYALAWYEPSSVTVEGLESSIQTLTDDVGTVEGKANKNAEDIAALQARREYTDEEATKLAGIAAGAQVNVLEGVQLNGADVAIGADKKANIVITQVDKANQLTNPQNFSLTGDVTASAVAFNGTDAVTLNTVLKSSGVTAGTYTKLTVDARGIVTSAEQASADDISGLGTAAKLNSGTGAGNVVIVGVDGKIDEAVIPSLAITDVFEADSQAAMLALGAQKGDVAVRSDVNRSFILKQAPASTAENWVELRTPTDAVLSVNGKTGAVTLTTTDVAEGSNQYWTEARFDTAFAAKSSAGLTDGATIVHSTDTLVLNCGNASGVVAG